MHTKMPQKYTRTPYPQLSDQCSAQGRGQCGSVNMFSTSSPLVLGLLIDQYSNSGGGSVNDSICTGGVGGVDCGALKSSQQKSEPLIGVIGDIALIVVAVLFSLCARSGGVSLYERGHRESERLLLIWRMRD
jgi:hypothetical protein